MLKLPLFSLIISVLLNAVASDFLYSDFNETSGLQLNGNAATTSCDSGDYWLYNEDHGVNDDSDAGSQANIVEEGSVSFSLSTFETATVETEKQTEKRLSSFPHRTVNAHAPDPKGCSIRVRLTPSRPYKRGSVMRLEPISILNGFETGFAVQFSGYSRHCQEVKDSQFSIAEYKSCSVRGGDGMSIVFHNDVNRSYALGNGGEGMGFEGIRNGLAVAFDTFYNGGGSGVTELPGDSLSIFTSSSVPGGSLKRTDAVRLGEIVNVSIADGRIHYVKVVYWPIIPDWIVPRLRVYNGNTPFLLDKGENRRVGVLAVYVDNMKRTQPAAATLVNLNAVLQTAEGMTFVGFTAGTGTAWQKHDIIQWHFCEEPGCLAMRGDPDLLHYFESEGD